MIMACKSKGERQKKKERERDQHTSNLCGKHGADRSNKIRERVAEMQSNHLIFKCFPLI